jgi:hypothetical protein
MIKYDPFLATLRADPRYAALVKKMVFRRAHRGGSRRKELGDCVCDRSLRARMSFFTELKRRNILYAVQTGLTCGAGARAGETLDGA